MNIRQIFKLGTLALTLCSLQALAQTGPSVTIGADSGQVGSATPVVIPMTYADDGTVVGFQFNLTYDSSSMTADISNCGGVLGGQTTACSEAVAGSILVLAFDSNLGVIPSGSLGSISFDISAAAVNTYPLAVTLEKYGDDTGADIPSTGSTDGSVTVALGPQPLFAATPASVALSGQISTTLQTSVVIDNSGGQAGSSLTYTCTKSADPSSKFTLGGDLTGTLSTTQTGNITVACDSSVIGAGFTGTMQCTHDGSNTTPVDIPLSCTVTAGPEPAYTGVATGLAMTAAEEGDPDPTGSVAITNTGDATTTLTGSCSLTGPDAQITVSNGAFSVVQGAAAHTVAVSCDASAEGSYTNTLSCTHNGTNTTSPVTYDVGCVVGPPGPAVYDSAPAPGSTIEMTPVGNDVPSGTPIVDSVLAILNATTDPNDRDLLIDCTWTGSPEITVTTPASPIAPNALSFATFSCDSTEPGAYTGTYSCQYNENGGEAFDGTATYTVNCGVRAAASDILETPASGTALSIVVPTGGSAQTSVSFAEILDEGIDATIDVCSFGTANFSVVTTIPATVTAGGSVEVTVEGTDPGDGTIVFNDTLTCTYTDSDSTPGTVSWPITMTVAQSVPIPTLSVWGMMLMILTIMGLGGIVMRRKVRS